MNLLENPALWGYEGPGLPPGWYERPDHFTVNYRTEQGAICVQARGRQDGYAWQRPAVKGGVPYRLSARVRTEGDVTAQLRLFFQDAEGRFIKRALSRPLLADSPWTELCVAAMAPPEAAQATVFLIAFAVGDGGTAWFAEPCLAETEGPVSEGTSYPSGVYDVLGSRTPPPPPDPIRLIPRPKEVAGAPGAFRLTPETTIVLPPAATVAHRSAAAALNRTLKERLGFTLPVAPPGLAPAQGCIVLGERGAQPLMGGLTGPGVPAEAPGPEGYRLLVRPEGVIIQGSAERGTYYGAQTLCQLIEQAGAELPGLSVRDWPDLPFRGLHVFAWGEAGDFPVRLVERVAARFKFSHIVVECSVANWACRPELHKPRGATREEVAAVVTAARANLLEPIPLIQSPGHSEWLFRNGANLDICADPEHPYAYDPRNPRAYEVILAIMDEAVDLFGARTIHIGHDEVRMVGRFPEPFEPLFVQDVDRIASHMRRRGVQTMLWADEVQTPNFHPFIKRLPPDLIMVDWNYMPFRRYTSLDYLQGNGFRTIGASWFDPYNIQTFARYAREAGALGMLQTTWAGYRLQYEPPQFGAHVVAGEFFWNSAGYADPAHLPYDPVAIANTALNARGER